MKPTLSTRHAPILQVASTFAAYLLMAAASVQAQPTPAGSAGSSDAAALADKLANPIAAVIQVPFQFNYDQDMGHDKQGSMTYMKFQPVVPFEVSRDWNYIVRPIVPVQWMRDVDGFSGNGVGQIQIESFFSPVPKGNDEFIWGLGPYLAFPSASGPEYGSKQWGVGASLAAIWRPGSWTTGALLYQSWSAGGSDISGTTNNTYWQPFVSYVTKDAWTFTLDTESIYNWDAHRASNPMNLIVSKLVFIDKMPVSFALGARYYLTSTPGGADGWGARATVSFVFPK